MIYIKDMDMPVDCLACRISCQHESYRVTGRPEDCPLEEAKTGDLISRADAIEAVADRIYDDLCYMYCNNCRYDSEIGEDDPRWSCDDCYRKYNSWGISSAVAKGIAEHALSALPSADAVSREVYDKRTQADERIIDSYRREFSEVASAEAVHGDLIIKGAKGIQDGLYNIQNGKLFKYKAKGGTVRSYPIVSAEAKGDLISRDVVLANIDERLRANGYGNVGLVSELNRLIGYVRNIPSAEAVQGEWGHMIAHGTDGSHWYEYECSHCGEVVLRPYNFCPNCGTMMYKDGDDTTGEIL